jgi:hypothetical protein
LKNGQKLKLGDAHVSPQEISEKYKCQSLGMSPRHPFFIGKNQVTFQYAIFLLLQALCVFLGASVVLFFSLVLFSLLQYMVGPQQIPFGEVDLLFICQEHSIFHSYNFNECSLFLELRLVFNFRLELCSDLDISFHQGVFLPLVYIGFHQKRYL